jgi:hypothetical protein
MALRAPSCHANSARCAQTLTRRIPCRRDTSRRATRVGPEVACRAGRRPCGCTRGTGHCRWCGRSRSSRRDCRSDSDPTISCIDVLACRHQSVAIGGWQFINPSRVGAAYAHCWSWMWKNLATALVFGGSPVSLFGSARARRNATDHGIRTVANAMARGSNQRPIVPAL